MIGKIEGLSTSDCWIWKSVEGKDGMVPVKPDLRIIAKNFVEEFSPRRVGKNLYIYDEAVRYWTCISKMDLDTWVNAVVGGEKRGMVNNFKKTTVSEVRNHLINEFDGPAVADGTNDLGVVDGYIPCKNGILNTKSGVLEPHGAHFGFEGGLDIDFPQDTTNLKTPHFDKFMSEICFYDGEVDEGKRKMMVELLGLCLSGVSNRKAEHIFILTGAGGNGKSVFCSLLQLLTGNRHSNLSTDNLKGNSSHSLAGSFVNIMEEQDASLGRKDWSTLKTLSAGNTMTVKQKYVDDRMILPTAKVVMTCNKTPSVHEDTDAIRRRLCIFELKNSFVGREDKFLLSKLKSELSGIFYKSVEAYRDFVKRGYKFEEVKSVKDASSEHQATGREIYKMFVDDCLELSPNRNVYVPKEYLHRAYNVWCDLMSGQSSFARERLSKQAYNIKEYLGELAREGGAISATNFLQANRSASGDGPFKRRMFQSRRVQGLFHVRLSCIGLKYLRESYKGQALPEDVPSGDTQSGSALHATSRVNTIHRGFKIVRGELNND